jgi:hypothetical protein
VHQLPVIREALLDVLDERGHGPRPWLRATGPAITPAAVPLVARAKAQLIAALGSAELRREAGSRGFRLNRRFFGVYGFDGSAEQYRRCLAAWFDEAADGDLLMCHPSAEGPERDAILPARRREYEVIGGHAFAALTDTTGVRIVPHATFAYDGPAPG